MQRSTYEAIVRKLRLPISAVPHFRVLAQQFDVSEHTLLSIYSQEVQNRVIRHHHVLKQSASELLQRYLAGANLLELCWELDLPPCIVLRRLLELLPLGLHREKLTALLRQPAILPEIISLEAVMCHAAALKLLPTGSDTPSTAGRMQHGAQAAVVEAHRACDVACETSCTPAAHGALGSAAKNDWLKQAAHAFQARLQSDVQACVACDRTYSPDSDASRREAGLEYERQLNDGLSTAGVSYWSEGQLRLQGYHKTPDARLRVPIAVCGRIVNWIDSKATFGDDRTHRQQMSEQYERYVNRFGPGLVIYWHGYLADLAAGDDAVLVLDGFPGSDDIFTLPCLPLSVAAKLPKFSTASNGVPASLCAAQEWLSECPAIHVEDSIAK